MPTPKPEIQTAIDIIRQGNGNDEKALDGVRDFLDKHPDAYADKALIGAAGARIKELIRPNGTDLKRHVEELKFLQ